MFFYEGYSCPVCGKAFREFDDIVACPECGAPHHRDCWKSIGHCAHADRHGTPEQWSRDEAAEPAPAAGWICGNCQKENPEFAEFCSRCGREKPMSEENGQNENADSGAPFYTAPFGASMGVDPLGGVPEYEPIDGVPAKEVATLVGANTAYYLPRFRALATGKRVSWNWAAFLLSPYWLFFRKCYLLGTVALILQTALSGLTAYAMNLLTNLLGDTPLSAEYYERIAAVIQDPTMVTVQLLTAVIAVGTLALHLFFGLFGNKLYQGTVIRRIAQLPADSPERHAVRLRTVGGVSPSLGIMSYLVVNYVTYLIQILLR